MIVACDPGKKGAFAVFTNKGRLVKTLQMAMPTKPRFPSNQDILTIQQFISVSRIRTAIIEGPLDKRTQGAVQHKNTQLAVWGVKYCLLSQVCDDVIIVPPNVWKRRMGLTADKKEPLRIVREMYPELEAVKLEKNHDVAEAILLGHYYGVENLNWDHPNDK